MRAGAERTPSPLSLRRSSAKRAPEARSPRSAEESAPILARLDGHQPRPIGLSSHLTSSIGTGAAQEAHTAVAPRCRALAIGSGPRWPGRRPRPAAPGGGPAGGSGAAAALECVSRRHRRRYCVRHRRVAGGTGHQERKRHPMPGPPSAKRCRTRHHGAASGTARGPEPQTTPSGRPAVCATSPRQAHRQPRSPSRRRVPSLPWTRPKSSPSPTFVGTPRGSSLPRSRPRHPCSSPRAAT